MKAVTAFLDAGCMLLVACGCVLAWLVVASASSTSAQAHAGHRHGATVLPAVIEQKAGTATPSDAADVAPSDATSTNSTSGRDTVRAPTQGSHHVGASTGEAADGVVLSVGGLNLKACGACGGPCGSCASMLCCSTVLAPQYDSQLTRPAISVPLPAPTTSMASTAVAPLQRPPNPQLLT
jgi:hypothetical protein